MHDRKDTKSKLVRKEEPKTPADADTNTLEHIQSPQKQNYKP